MRMIDADALAKFIDYGHLNNPNEKLYSENDIREMIDMMPTIDAVPVKHGRWVGNERHTSCSICGQTYCVPDGQDGHLDMTFYKYCPNCGARMDAND